MKINDISSNFFSLNSLKQSHLSKFAVNEKDALREVSESTEGLYRNAFQIDRDRIIHTNSFRRLKHKSQVFVAPDGDHYTTRLTHVIEVSQIGRTIARALNLNEDLVEAAALGHDLGHTPFGHIGESALNEISTLFLSRLTRLTFFSNSYLSLISFFSEQIFKSSSNEFINFDSSAFTSACISGFIFFSCIIFLI